MSEKSKTRRGSSIGRIVGISLGTLLFILIAAYGVGWIIAGDTMPRGTSVAGVSIEGLSSQQAVEKLKSEIGSKMKGPFVLSGGGKSAELDPERIGLSLDYEATVASAGGRSLNPMHIIRAFFGGGPVDLVVRTDAAALNAALSEAAPTFVSSAKSASISYSGVTVVRTPGTDDVSLNTDSTFAKVKEAWAAGQMQAEAVLDSKPPAITTEQADSVVKFYAEPAVSGPIEVTTDGGSFTITPQMIAAATTFVEKDNSIIPDTSADRLLDALAPTFAEMKFPAVKEASFTFSDGHPTIVPSAEGLAVDKDAFKKDVLPLVTQLADRKVKLPLSRTVPKFSTADAEKLGVKEVTGEWTTYFPDTAYRNNNLPRAAAALNGTLIKPGETFSFNKVVGQRTAESGYSAGGAICPGNKLCQQMGGGVSQVATTTYNAFFFSGLKHISHQPHTLYFDRYPAGRESTIDWGHIDVSFYNDSPYGVYIEGVGVPGSKGKQGSVTIRVWSTKEYDVRSSDLVRSNPTSGRRVESSEPDCAPQAGAEGFTVKYERQWYKDGQMQRSEPYSWTYASTDTIVCTKP